MHANSTMLTRHHARIGHSPRPVWCPALCHGFRPPYAPPATALSGNRVPPTRYPRLKFSEILICSIFFQIN